MACFVCIHGAGGHGAYWDLVAAELRPLGHEVVAMDLPCDQDVGFDANVAAVVDAIGDRRDDIVLVAQSLAAMVRAVGEERMKS
jgi:pimeloyl-ACP methyl ester carboxylesterase